MFKNNHVTWKIQPEDFILVYLEALNLVYNIGCWLRKVMALIVIVFETL